MSPVTPVNDATPRAREADAVAGGPLSPLVAFVPGLGLDSRSWPLVRKRLGGQSVVVLLPSLGEPAPRGTDLAVERQAVRLLESLPTGQSIILVGHSASCPVVVQAASHGSDVVGLVLVGPVTDPAAQSWPRMLSQWLRTACHERLGEVPTLVPQYRHTGISSMLRGMDATRHFRTDLALGRLELPVEIVRGETDRIASHEWSSRLRHVSDGRLTTVHGAAHMVPLTDPSAVAEAVERLRSEKDLWATAHRPGHR